MKKILSIILTLTMVFSLMVCCVFNSSAADKEIASGTIAGTNISWSVVRDSLLYTNYSKYSLTVSGKGVIPDFEGYGGSENSAPWMQVKDGYFGGNHVSYDSVTIGDDITAIGKFAFYNMGAETWNIGSSIANIRDDAFYACYGLKSIKFSSSCESIGKSAFADCSKLKTVDFSQCTRLETISNNAFSGTAIESLELPNSIVTIESYAFGNCSSLKNIACCTENNVNFNSYAFKGNNKFTAYVLSESPAEVYFNSLTGIKTKPLYKVTFKTDECKFLLGLIKVPEKTYAVYFGCESNEFLTAGRLVNPPENPSERWVEFTGWDKATNEYAYPTENMEVKASFKVTLSSLLKGLFG